MNSAIPTSSIRGSLKTKGVVIRIGPFLVKLRSSLESVATAIALHYDNQLLNTDVPFCDFHVRIDRPRNLHRFWHPQARFYLDESTPFRPLPVSQAYPLFEWGLNWCIAQHAHHFLMVHAAVVERNGRALILPGEPGAGKSTLTAALVLSGWRLLSDEFALISVETGQLTPLPRPVSLKNESIAIIRERFSSAIIGVETYDTSKGTVAHLKAPPDCVDRADDTAQPAWVVFPRYIAGAKNHLQALNKAHALLRLAESSFNFSVLGGRGFEAAADLVEKCDCYDLRYGDLDSLLSKLEDMSVANQ